MKRRIKNKILLWFRIGVIPAMIFSLLNAVGITTLAAPKNDTGTGIVNSSIITSQSPGTIKPTPISEAVIESAPLLTTDISYLTIGTSAAIYQRADAVISVILPDGTVRELPKQV
jgi:hypothetical protein